MELFEIQIAKCEIREGDGPFTPDGFVFNIPQEAEELLDKILEPYGGSSTFYFERMEFDNQPAPWALVCLDREYPIAGHIVTKRPSNGKISFTQYSSIPKPKPSNFVPNVGTLVIQEKGVLELATGRSLVFKEAWKALKECSLNSNWLVFLDPLPEKWLAEQLPGDRELYLSTLTSLDDDRDYGQPMSFDSLRDHLCENAVKWQEKYRVAPNIISAISEFDAARLVGMSEEEYAERERGRTSAAGFIFREMRYQVLGTRREGIRERPESIVIHKRPSNYDWDYLIWIRYNKSYVIQEAWRWDVVLYTEYFNQNDRMTLNDMRLGENLLRN
jgi:hypothetical protein